jgi:hypothetical protein
MNRRKSNERNEVGDLEHGLDDSLSVEDIIGNRAEPIEAIGSDEGSKGPSESRKRKRRTGHIFLEETLQVPETKRAEQEDVHVERGLPPRLGKIYSNYSSIEIGSQ